MPVGAAPGGYTSPLAGRVWDSGQQLAASLGTNRTLRMGIDDQGRVIVAASTTAIGTQPFVVHGRPNGAGAAQWSAPRSLASFGTRTGEAVPSDLRVTRLYVASGGRAVLTANQVSAGQTYWSTYDPDTDAWAPLELLGPTGRIGTDINVVINSRGDVALASRNAILEGSTTFRLLFLVRQASDSAVREYANVLPVGGSPGVLSLADDGGIAWAQVNQSRLVVARGRVESGFFAVQQLGDTAAPVLQNAWLGRNGQHFVAGAQSTRGDQRPFLAHAPSFASGYQVNGVSTDISVVFTESVGRSVVDDTGRLLMFPSRVALVRSDCLVWRWSSSATLESLAPNGSCTWPSSTSTATAISRTGQALAVASSGAWSTYDVNLGTQTQTVPLSGSTGVGWIFGAATSSGANAAIAPITAIHDFNMQAQPINGISAGLALSASGVGALVFIAPFDTLPTAANRAGSGSITRYNLWGIYYK